MIVYEKIAFVAIERFQYISQTPSLTFSPCIIYMSHSENDARAAAATHGDSQCRS